MYFKLFKPQDWRKRSGEARRRNCAGLPYTTTRPLMKMPRARIRQPVQPM